MRTSIIRIGNSSGIILPTEALRKLRLSRKSLVDIDFTDDNIVIKPAPRQGWAEEAKQMAKAGDDELLLPDVLKNEDLNWWQWEEK